MPGAVGSRRVSLTILSALLLALTAAPAQARRADAPPPAKPCAAKGSTTYARTAQARVYARTTAESDDHVLVGCLLGSGRRVTLDSWFSCGCSRGDEFEPQVWARGTVIAINRYSCPPDPLLGLCNGRAHTVELRTGRTLREATTGGAIGQLVIGPRGSFAVIAARGVLKSDADGEAVLDPEPGVEPGSLALAGSLLYWTRDGVPRSVRLRP